MASYHIPAAAAANSFTQALSSLARVLSDRGLTTHSGSSDFLPRAPPALSVWALWRVWQLHMHSTYVLEGELTDKWFPFLLLCWVVLTHTRRLLRTPLDQANNLPLSGQFRNIFLDELTLLYYLLQSPFFWISKFTFPNKPLAY